MRSSSSFRGKKIWAATMYIYIIIYIYILVSRDDVDITGRMLFLPRVLISLIIVIRKSIIGLASL